MSTSPRNVQRILFTNTAIAGPTGTELYIRDLAREFRTRGCDVVIYTPRIGPLAAELHGLGIPVVRVTENSQSRPCPRGVSSANCPFPLLPITTNFSP